MSPWDLWSIVSKSLSLAGMAAVIGGSVCLYLGRQLDGRSLRGVSVYILTGAVLGLVMTGLFFFIQVGAINQSGFRGLWDSQMAAILLQSGLGYATGLRMLGFVLAMLLAGMFFIRQGRRYGWLGVLLGFAAAVALGASFLLTGHVSALAATARAGIAIHVLAAFFWVGSLYPLWLFCKVETQPDGGLQRVMEQFGRFAVVVITLLLISGVFLLTRLLESFGELTGTAYGQSMLLKLSAVVGLLSLGALNKFFLVPGLCNANGVRRLKRSIVLEMTIALLILAVTAYLTTLTGISHV